MINKISIGSAQFGLDYGISNKKGKIQFNDVKKILAFAYEKGISHIDTAPAYGESEQAIGDIIREQKSRFKITTKITAATREQIQSSVHTSLTRLGVEKLHAVLFHDFKSFDRQMLAPLIEFKKEGKIDHLGFSVYFPEELDWIMNNQVPCDMVQIPCNLFDHRFLPLLDRAVEQHIMIQARSVFLQGLFFLEKERLAPHFGLVSGQLDQLQQLSRQSGMGIHELCLGFVMSQPNIDNVIIGIESLDNLKENIQTDFQKVGTVLTSKVVEALRVDDESILVPYQWKI